MIHPNRIVRQHSRPLPQLKAGAFACLLLLVLGLVGDAVLAATAKRGDTRGRATLLAQLSAQIARNPQQISQILTPALARTPAHRDYIATQLIKQYPGYARAIAAAAGTPIAPQLTPKTSSRAPSLRAPRATTPYRRQTRDPRTETAVSLAAAQAIAAIAANPQQMEAIAAATYARYPAHTATLQRRLAQAYPAFAARLGSPSPVAAVSIPAQPQRIVQAAEKPPPPVRSQSPEPIVEAEPPQEPARVFHSAEEISDPLEPLNRTIQHFNDGVDYVLLRPLAWAYNRIVPDPIIQANRRFFRNLREPVIAINDTIQLSVEDATQSVVRFGLNSTIGFFGFFEVAEVLGFPPHHADFGQTLHHYGTAPGPYIVLPLIGPSTARDAVGRIVDTLTDPLTYLLNPAPRLAVTAAGAIVQREELLVPLDSLRQESLDFYSTLRSAYYQTRVGELNKGRVSPASNADVDALFDEVD